MADEIILSGSEETLKPIISLLIGVHQLLENRDIGDIVGMPLEEFVRAQPHTIKLTIFWYPNKTPPFSAGHSEKLVRPYCNIPDVDKKKLDWGIIKQAAGGTNGYSWGRFRATANLDNGRQMKIHASTEEEASKMLKNLAELSTAKILTLSITEEKKEGRREQYQTLFKETTKVYPAYFVVINSEKILVESERQRTQKISNLKSTTKADFKRKRTQKIFLWVDKEPELTKEIIREALQVRGSAKDDG
ncbi:hypothetical protein PI95_031755 [Hassallia byssoidea VB512170]|uniref:Uncharacterized protein n=1 Tax=Hassallia byssoidea VB512170 TaxID=1304833 RepID=A0A846HKQ3_9CYAN|nr:hypothetical protein [Hassalia byssoidea]NEU76950.1 hypothetical protein [Hassalia byssoidea VB512170]